MEDQAKHHTQLAIAQQELSKSFRSFHEMAQNLTFHIQTVGNSLFEQRDSILKDAEEAAFAAATIQTPPVTVSCPPIDYSELYGFLAEKDVELEQFRENVSKSLVDLEDGFGKVIALEHDENFILKKRIAELEQSLANAKERSRQVETALLQCVTVDELRQTAVSVAQDLASKMQSSAVPVAPHGDMICFETLDRLQAMVSDLVSSSVLPYIKQTLLDRFSELSRINEQVGTYLNMREKKKEELIALKDVRDRHQDCLLQKDASSLVSSVVSRECSGISAVSLGIDELLRDAKLAMPTDTKSLAPVHPPDHAQRGAGGEIVHALTSPTFSRIPQLLLKSKTTGLNVNMVASYVWDSLSHLFNIENGIGKPEDAISHKVTLGQCWAMAV